MTIFKKGQRVWWDDPICEESGEYEVLDSQDEINAGKLENERIIVSVVERAHGMSRPTI